MSSPPYEVTTMTSEVVTTTTVTTTDSLVALKKHETALDRVVALKV